LREVGLGRSDSSKSTNPRCPSPTSLTDKLEQSNLSQHLQALAEAGLVAARRDGVRMMYRVAESRVFKVLDLAGVLLRKQFAARAELLEVL
jgi:DNA-binding transcriptional ArsR family regulator